MTLLDLLNVVDEDEAIYVRYIGKISNSRKLKESNPMINILDTTVKHIKMDGCSMLFVDVE